MAAIATFFAVYVPARNYKIDVERRAKRDLQISYIEINRLLPKVRDVQVQVNFVRKQILPEIPQILKKGKASAKEVAEILRIKGAVPFAILSDGLEMISIGVSNLQTNLDALSDYLDDASSVELHANHAFNGLDDYKAALNNIDVAARNVLLAISKIAKVDVSAYTKDFG